MNSNKILKASLGCIFLEFWKVLNNGFARWIALVWATDDALVYVQDCTVSSEFIPVLMVRPRNFSAATLGRAKPQQDCAAQKMNAADLT